MHDMTIGARELKIFTDNDAQLVRMRTNIAKNLATYKARKQYSKDKAVKAFMYLANAGAKGYVKEYGSRQDKWSTMFDTADRKSAAVAWVEWFEAEHKLGNFESILPKKYQKAATKKASQKAFGVAAQKREGSRPLFGVFGKPAEEAKKRATAKRAERKRARGMRIYKTRWAELGFAKIGPGMWQFLDITGDQPKQVGPHYPTREALVADTRRYASEGWGLS